MKSICDFIDLDPDSSNFVDLDPHTINADPHSTSQDLLVIFTDINESDIDFFLISFFDIAPIKILIMEHDMIYRRYFR